MTPEQSYSAFRSFLKTKQRTLKSLSVSDAAAFMFEFYRAVRAAGTSPKTGDGLVFAYGIVQRPRGSPYELSIIRLFTTSDESPAPNGSRLRLSLGYNWLSANSWFAQQGHEFQHGSSRCAWSLDSAMTLYQEFLQHNVFLVLQDQAPRTVELRYEPRWNLFA